MYYYILMENVYANLIFTKISLSGALNSPLIFIIKYRVVFTADKPSYFITVLNIKDVQGHSIMNNVVEFEIENTS